MKKMLMLAACASQLLLLPQINAMNNKIIQDFEIDNGILGFLVSDRDAYFHLLGRVAHFNGATSVRELSGVCEETAESMRKLANEFKKRSAKKVVTEQRGCITRFIMMVEVLRNREINIFQQRTSTLVLPNDMTCLAGFIHANNNDVLIATWGGVPMILRALRMAADYSVIMYRSSKSNRWKLCDNDLLARKIERINKYLFAFCVRGKPVMNTFSNDENIYTSKNGIDWSPFFQLPNPAAMTHDGNKYMVVTEDGTLFTKEGDTEWQKNENLRKTLTKDNRAVA
jgi:hypothetical protein